MKTTSEEEMRAYTIGELKPLTGPIVVSDYDPAWPASFEREAARIRAILGDRVRLLEHAGSTSVPGLPAKPIIDIVLAVPDSSDEAAYVPALEGAGYVLRIREPDWFEHRVFNRSEAEVEAEPPVGRPRSGSDAKRPGFGFKGPDTDINLHVFTAGCTEIDQMLRLRDWLRTHPDERDRYAATKRELAKRDWKYVQHYADAKTDIVHEILARARAG